MFALIHKPRGVSSFECIRRFARDRGIKKIGHAGTLDLLAEGLLLVATDRSTRLLSFLPHTDKTYEASIRFDGWTATGDLESEPESCDPSAIEHARNEFSREKLDALLRERFIGRITQVPSVFSAIWIDGKRAYELARKWHDVAMPSREVEIYSIEILRYEFPECVLRARVSSGTYIRTLADDIGQAMGVRGYLTWLDRMAIGPFEADRLSSSDEWFAQLILPEVFSGMPILETEESVLAPLSNGMPIENHWGISEGVNVFLSFDGRILALMESRGEMLRVLRNDLG